MPSLAELRPSNPSDQWILEGGYVNLFQGILCNVQVTQILSAQFLVNVAFLA